MRKLYTFIFIFFVLLISAQDFNHGGKPVTEGVTVIKRVEKTDFKVQEGTERSTLAQRLPEDGTVPTEPDPIEFDPPMDSAEPTEPTDPVEGSGFDPTTIVNSTGVTKGDLSVSLTGGANYNVPIAVPPGINGTVPQLSLVYDSQSGNGLVGWGWNISGISTISRIPSTKFHDNSIDAVDFDSYDRFSFDGQRLMLKSGVYGSDGAIYETESYKNLRITSLGTSSYGSNYGPNYFVVEYPDGSKAYYGQNTNSKSKLTWAITYWENPLGVRISYEYTSSGNNLFISKVKYGSLNNNTAINEIQFIYTTRNRNEQAYVGGESFLTSKLLNQIKVMGNGEGFRNYYLSHNTTSLGYQRLYSITEKTGDNSMALNSTLFDYSTTDNSESFQISNPITLNVGDINSINSSTASGDFDGDGKMDFILYPTTGDDAYKKYWVFKDINGATSNIGYSHDLGKFDDIFPVSWLGGSVANGLKLMPQQGWAIVQSNTVTNNVLFKTFSLGTTSPIYAQDIWQYAFPKYIYSYTMDCNLVNKNNTQELNSLLPEPDPAPTEITVEKIIPKRYVSGDFDGDGISDLIAIEKSFSYYYYMNCNGYNLTYSGGRTFLVHLDRRLNSNNFVSMVGSIACTNDSKIIVADFNGDGKSDLLVFDTDICRVYTLNNTNTSFTQIANISDTHIKTDKPILMGDYNGDGKSDFVIPQVEGTDSWSFFFSKGNEFQNVNTGIGFPYIESIVDYFPIYGEIYRCVQENTFISSDLNGDGKTDILLQSNYTGANTGDPYLINFRVFENKGFDGSSIIFEQNYINSQIGGIKRYPIPIFLDHNHINQNLEYAVISDNTIRTFKSTKDNKIDNQLNEITLGNGVKEIITYSALKEDSSSYNSVFAPSTYTENYPNFDIVVSPSFKVVSKIEMQSSTVYKKQDYKYYGAVSNVEGLGFLGFRGLTKTNWYNDDYPIISNISKYDIAKRGAVTESFSEMGISTANTSYTPTNFITKSVLNYEDELLPNKVYKIKNTSSEIFNGLNNTSQEAVTTFDTYNNPLQTIIKYKLGATVQKTETTTLQYENLTTGGSYIIGRPLQKNTEAVYGSSTMTSEELYSYNSSHLLSQVKKKGDNTSYIAEDNQYDSFGNVIQKTITVDGLSPRVTNYEYDLSGRFLLKSIDIEGLETIYTYNESTGLLLTETNPYGLTTTYEYDVWFRERKVTDYLGKRKMNVFSMINTNNVKVESYGDDDSQSITIFDDLGREIISGVKNIDDSWSYIKTDYDIYNRKISVSEPYGDLNSSPTQFNTTSFDNYGRVVEVIAYTGKTNTLSYSGLTTVSNDGYKTVSTIKDAVGNVVKTTDEGGAISYRYFANGNLKQSDYDGVVVSVEQDGWGRKNKLADPSAGTYEYKYNDFGELIWEKTPKGETTYSLNDYGKIIEKEVVGDETHLISYYDYDGTSKLLTGISTNLNTSYSYEYDSYNRLWRTTEFNPYASYQTAIDFDDFGRSAREYQHSYHNASGKSSSIWTKNVYKNGKLWQILDDGSGDILWQVNSINTRGQLTSVSLGNGIDVSKAYDAYGYLNNTYHLKQNGTGLPTNIATLSTTFEPIRGNLTSRYNSLFNWSEAFNYDNLDRLIKYTDASGNQIEQIYEQDGRIKENNMGTYNYSNSSKKYQNTSIDITNESLAYYQNRLGLFNDSMESKKGWMIYDSSVFSYDTSVASSGNVSLKVANTTSTEKVVNSEYWLQIDNAQPTEYTYSVKVKSDGTNPEAEIFLFMKTETETGSFTLVDQKVSATSTDWIEIEKTFLVPANIKKLNIRLDNNETGNLWFDDVRIRKTNQPTPTERELNITYNAFKSPVEIYEPGTDRISFDYNVFQSRSTMYYGNEETDKMLRKYRKHYSGIGSMEIKHDIETGEVEFVTYLGGDAYSAPVVLKSDGTTQETLYLHRDYLGSIVLITDKVGEIVEKRLFDAWGDVIQVQDGNNNVLTGFAVLDRGYTGHEHLQSVALVHMNGRLYDAKLHRFLQPDNFVQDPYNTQNYNRYGYVLNNPLKYTDPSGEFWHIVIGAVVGGVVNLTVKAFQGKINSWGDGFAAFGVGAVAGAVGAATGGAAYAAAGGGGFLAGAAGGAVGTAFASPIQSMGNTIFFNDPMMTGKQYVTGIFIGGVTGGLISGSVSAFKGNNFWTGNDVANGRSIFSLNNTSRYTPNNTSYNVSVDGVERVINSETISETLEGFGIEASFKNPIYKEVVDKYLGQMTNETFDLSKTNMAGGFMSKGNVQITSGHHRIIAATIRGMQTGDYSILEALIRNGRFDQVSNPSNYGYSFSKFPQIWK